MYILIISFVSFVIAVIDLGSRDSLVNLMNTYKGQILFYILLTNAGVNLVRLALSDLLRAGLQHSLFVHVPTLLHFSVRNTQT
jgi:hypothetical protein